MSSSDWHIASEPRIALIIGNSDYQYARPLTNTKADAIAIASALAQAGFKSHTTLADGSYAQLAPFENSTLIEMRRLLADFSEAAEKAEMAIIYYSGYGIEINLRNFLVPIDAQLPHVRRVSHEAVQLSDVIEATYGASQLRLIILDACRDNPFLHRMKGLDIGKSANTKAGLGAPNNPGAAWVFYAATEGQIASEGPTGGISPFAASLSKRLLEPKREIFRVLGKVTEDVSRATRGAQEPKFYGSPPADEIYLFQKNERIEEPENESKPAVLSLPERKPLPEVQKKDKGRLFSLSFSLTFRILMVLVFVVPVTSFLYYDRDYVLSWLTGPPVKSVTRVCMGEGGGDNCLSGSDATFDCDVYHNWGAGGKMNENLGAQFCSSVRHGNKVQLPFNVTLYRNNGGGKCGWTGFIVTCNP
jgi:Caspase domain